MNRQTIELSKTVAGAVFLVLLLFHSSAYPATRTVTSTADSGAGTLRNQLAAAVNGDTINFSLAYPATITLSSELTINKSLVIVGPGSDKLTISGNNAVRIFYVTGGTSSISDVTVANGRLSSLGDSGAAFRVTIGASLTVSRCYIHSNSTDITNAFGAAIHNFGTITISNSTLANNTGFEGPALRAESGSATTITNCTISGNHAYSGGGSASVVSYGNMTVINSTITGNIGEYWESGLSAYGGSLNLKNTIIAGNNSLRADGANLGSTGDSDIFFDTTGAYCTPGPACPVTFTSSGYNLIGSEGSQDYIWQSRGASDIVGEETAKQNAGLNTTLADNGGYTRTHALNWGSQAINPFNSNGAPWVDQRGYLRSGNADKGAYEYNGALPVATAATGVGTTYFSANWNAVSGATGYLLDVATDSGFTSFVTNYHDLLVSGGTTTTVTGLSSGTTYYYRIRVDFGGNYSYYSNTVTVTLAAPPTTTVSTAALSADAGNNADWITNTAAQTISGSLSANLASGESVQVSYDNGSAWANATTFSVGSNAWATTTTLAGSNTFQARVTNSDGSSAAYTHTYTFDSASPTISSGTLAASNAYLDISFNEGVYGASDGVTALSTERLTLTFTRNGGSATNAVISSVKKNDNAAEGSASALIGGETTVRVFLTITGTPSGIETIEVKPANGASVYDRAGNAMSAAQTTGVKTLNDKLAPTVSSVSVPANATYGTGQDLDFTVNWSEPVTVIGTDSTLGLTIGSTSRLAAYQSKTAASITYRYTVQTGELDTDGITVGVLTLNAAAIRDAANNNAALTLNSVGSTAGVSVDAVVPTVTSVSVPADATYIAGQDLDFTVNFSEAVTVVTAGGTPYLRITLDTGGTVNAAYLSGTGASALVFRYTVVSGNRDMNGIAVGGSITASGGTLKDVAGNNAALTLNNVGSTAGVLVGANTAPLVPTLIGPASASEVLSTSPTLTVNASIDPDSDPVSYLFEIDRVSSFDSVNKQSSGIVSSVTWTTAPLIDNTTWYWRVRATDGAASSAWMSTADFFVNTANDAPSAPAVSSPANNGKVPTASPTLTVTNASDMDHDTLTYEFEVCADSGCTGGPVANATGIIQSGSGTTFWTVTPALAGDGTWYWRAWAKDEHGISGNYVTGAFIVDTANAAPAAPAISAPATGSEVTGTTPALTVTNATDPDGDALVYTFEIDTVNTFNSANKQASGMIVEGAGTTSWTPSTLTDNTTWHWRVRTNDGLADSPWMTTASLFVNTANDAPGAPALLNPANGSDVTVLSPTLSVNPAIDADHDILTYDFQVYSDSGLTSLVTSATSAGASWVIAPALTDNTRYWWTARAIDEHGFAGGRMAASSFFVNNNGVDVAPAITLTKPAADEPTITGNSFTIVWTDSDPDSDAVVTLGYDTTGTGCNGTQIVTGISEDDSANSYTWDITELPQGAYFIYASITDGTTTNCSYAAGQFIRSNTNGDLNNDGTVDVFDALKALRVAAGIKTASAADLQRGDVAPIVGGTPRPDGKLDIGDVVVILRKAVGLVSW